MFLLGCEWCKNKKVKYLLGCLRILSVYVNCVWLYKRRK